MPKKKGSSISVLYKSNRSKIVEAAIKSNFLELLKENQSEAFNSFLCNIYTRKFASKSEKQNYISNLKAMWNRNKEDLTKEINLHKKTQKNPESPLKNLSVQQTNKKIHKYSPVKQKNITKRVTRSKRNQGKVVEEIKSQLNDCNKDKKCEFLEDQSNVTSINKKEKFTKAKGTSKPKSVKQFDNVNECISSDDTYHSSESPASKTESEKNSLEQNYNSISSLESDENTEFSTIKNIQKKRTWTVSKAKIKNIICFKTHRLQRDWANIVYDDYINKHNPYCVLGFNNSHVKKKGSNKKNSPLFKATAYCRHSSCKTNHTVIMREM